MTLTPKQKQIYDFIKKYSEKKGISPSQEEIAKKFKLAVSTIHEHLSALERKGYIKKEPGHARTIEIIEPSKNTGLVKIPLLGTIAAGQPIEAIQTNETIAVPKNKIRTGNIYALRVMGNSMVDENINDGDVVLVREQSTAENGQKVVALLDNYEATLKKFYKEKGYIRLQPANKNLEPLIIRNGKDISIQGMVLDIIHDGGSPTIQFPEKRQEEEKNSLQNPYYKKPGFVLYNGDSLKILSKIPESSVDMIFADPPYNLSNGGFSVHAGKMVSVNKGDWDKSKGFNIDYNFHYNWLAAAKRVLKPGGSLWVSGTYHSIYQCGHALQALGYHILNDVSWFKPNAAPNLSCRFFTASHETLIWARKEKTGKHVFNYKIMKDRNWSGDFLKKPSMQMRSVWAIGAPKPEEKKFGKHPTQKPEELLKRIILASTNEGDLVVDPFTGSSTTGMVAYSYKRNFMGIDTEKKYLDLSIKRFEELERNDNKLI